MRALDHEINHFNVRRPDGSMIPLELSTPFFAMDLKIPDPYKRGGKLLWPPPQPNLALQYLASMPPDPFIISEAAKGTYIDNRNRQIVEDNQRVAEAAQRQREREEREAAEARKAQEAERAAYYAKHGWPT